MEGAGYAAGMQLDKNTVPVDVLYECLADLADVPAIVRLLQDSHQGERAGDHRY